MTIHSGPLSWEKLAELIEKMPPEQKQTDVTVCCNEMEEFFQVCNLAVTDEANVIDEKGGFRLSIDDEADVLDENHPYLVIPC